MSRFISYQIVENNLILFEDLNSSLINSSDEYSIQEWIIHNYNKETVSTLFLTDITSNEISVRIEESNTTTKLLFSFTDERGCNIEYTLGCTNVTPNKRSYSIEEFTKKAIDNLRSLSWYYQQSEKYRGKLYDIKRFAQNEIQRKNNILNTLTDKESKAYIKANSQLDILNQIISFTEKL